MASHKKKYPVYEVHKSRSQARIEKEIIELRKSLGFHVSKQAKANCLRCENNFISPDVKQIKLCVNCNEYAKINGW